MIRFLSQHATVTWRSVRSAPGFAAVVVLMLALGIGANTAALGLLRGVLLKPLPYDDPERLVLLWHRGTEAPEGRGPLSSPDLMDYRERSRTLEDLAAVNSFSAALTGDGEAEQIQLGVISANFLSVLGVRPALGRDFTAADDTPLDTRDPRNTSVIILSHELWQRRYGGEPGVLGRTLLVGGTPMIVVGILPRGFRLHLPVDAGMSTELAAWTPLRIPYASAPREGAYLKALGRLRADVTLTAAQHDMDGIAAGLRERFPYHATAGLRVAVRPLGEEVTAHIRPTLVAVTAAALLVLLVACANVANLYLARLVRRHREMTIRAALGGTPRQLTVQLLTEAGCLAMLAGIAGVALGWGAVRMVRWLQPATLPRIDGVHLDFEFLALGALLAGVTLLVFGLAPSLLAARPRLVDALSSRGASEHRGWRLASAGLVILQAASAMVLLTATGLMVRSVASVANAELGYQPRQVVTFRASLPFTAYRTPDRWIAVFADLEQSLAALPGIDAVGSINALPSSGSSDASPYEVEPGANAAPSGARQAESRIVTPGYFATMGIALRTGRVLTEGDGPASPFVLVVDETIARREWGESSALGKRLRVPVARFERGYTVEETWGEVVGVVEPVAHGRADARHPGTIYLSHRQAPLWNMAFAVRSSQEVGSVLASVRQTFAAFDANLPVFQVQRMTTMVAATTAEVRAALAAAGFFAFVAVTLAVVGLYGVVAVGVRRRRRELGIRLALGARPRSMTLGVIGEGVVLGAAGVGIGLVGVALLMGYVRDLLVGVSATDPRTMVLASLALIGLTAFASWFPAREAARINPVETLGQE